jgi:hypothetical protein
MDNVTYARLQQEHSELQEKYAAAIASVAALMIQARKLPTSESNKAALELGQKVLSLSI